MNQRAPTGRSGSSDQADAMQQSQIATGAPSRRLGTGGMGITDTKGDTMIRAAQKAKAVHLYDVGTLTPRQQSIHAWMLKYQHEHGRPPTIRGIGDAFGIRSPNGMANHLLSMARKGFVRRIGTMEKASARAWLAIVPGAEERITCTRDGSGVKLDLGGVVAYLSRDEAVRLMGELAEATR